MDTEDIDKATRQILKKCRMGRRLGRKSLRRVTQHYVDAIAESSAGIPNPEERRNLCHEAHPHLQNSPEPCECESLIGCEVGMQREAPA